MAAPFSPKIEPETDWLTGGGLHPDDRGVVLRKTLLQLGTNDEFDVRATKDPRECSRERGLSWDDRSRAQSLSFLQELMLNSQKQVTTCRGREARAVQQGLYKAYEWARAAEADDSDDSSVSQ